MAGHKRLYVHPRAMHIIYTIYIYFLNHRFHIIGKYVQNYLYRLSADMANIGPIPIPIIGQSLAITNVYILIAVNFMDIAWQKHRI